MSIPFTKMHGLGNDFIVVNAITSPVRLNAKDISHMSDRRRGIGFDQLLMIEAAKDAAADFHYRIFNADGSEAEQCGNGARCIGRYLYDNDLIDQKEFNLSCKAGLMEVVIEPNELVTVNMGSPVFDPTKLPFNVKHEQLIYNLTVAGAEIHLGVLGMGNPHAVICVDSLDTVDIEQVGRAINEDPHFPQGVNVGFMQVTQPYQASLCVYERGPGRTLACGSGACAAMVYGNKLGILDREVNMIQEGGELIIKWSGGANPVYMTGPAESVFTGYWL